MPLALVQPGQGAPRVVVFGFLIDATILGPSLRTALGPDPCIVTDTSAHGKESPAELIATAKRLGRFDETAGYAYVGYSMGCQRVRGLLAQGADPCAVLAIDGTHDTYPRHANRHIWEAYVARARARERLFVGTCTQQTYTEQLHSPFASTLRVLEALAGGPLPPNTEARDGDFHALSYPSKRIDGPAHIAQAREVLPAMCTRYLEPWLRGWLRPLTRPAEERLPVHNEPWTPLGERCVRWCENELARGIRETPPGSNTSERIRDYLAPCVRRATGRLLGLRAAAWCAAAQCAAMRECLAPGEVEPHGYYCSMVELLEDAKARGLFTQEGKRGDIVLMTRTGSDPKKAAWEGHVARVVSITDTELVTIGGNESDAWHVSTRPRSDSHIIGFLSYP